MEWVIYQKSFSKKLSYFPMFGSNLTNELENMNLYSFVSHGCNKVVFKINLMETQSLKNKSLVSMDQR